MKKATSSPKETYNKFEKIKCELVKEYSQITFENYLNESRKYLKILEADFDKEKAFYAFISPSDFDRDKNSYDTYEVGFGIQFTANNREEQEDLLRNFMYDELKGEKKGRYAEYLGLKFTFGTAEKCYVCSAIKTVKDKDLLHDEALEKFKSLLNNILELKSKNLKIFEIEEVEDVEEDSENTNSKHNSKSEEDLKIKHVEQIYRTQQENRLNNVLYNELKNHLNLNDKQIKCEKEQVSGGKSDVELKIGNERIIFEIKTGSEAKYCIRRAIGQLLEYAYYPESEKANKIIIATDKEFEKDDITYIKILNETVLQNANLYIQRLEKNKKTYKLNMDDLKKWCPKK
ncbi:MAG: hypothetical protein MJ250_03740 [Alphaproteobacteria bacterium]|nr:hypothetical protein [Alphaproteobacteria bacterium]